MPWGLKKFFSLLKGNCTPPLLNDEAVSAWIFCVSERVRASFEVARIFSRDYNGRIIVIQKMVLQCE